MDALDSSKLETHPARSPPAPCDDKYSGEWAVLRECSVEWMLLNWPAERPVALQVVGSAW